MARRAALCVAAGLVLAGCAGPVGLYHQAEGGEIAQNLAPPPGADLPYPNLADVPAAPVRLTAAQSAAVTQRLTPGTLPVQGTQANEAALAGLTLPDAAPPPPAFEGLSEPSPAEVALAPPPAPPAPKAVVKLADGVPVALAFPPGSAILDPGTVKALTAIAAARGSATMLAAGFGDQAGVPDGAALTLALRRARAIADALTAAGVPANDVVMQAGAAGSGGFVQLVY